jgi:hypothetical protein
VLPIVPGQLVRPRKLPSATLPTANIGLLSSVRSLVRLEVTRLGVGLDASLDGTLVDHRLSLCSVPLSLWLLCFARRSSFPFRWCRGCWKS